MMVPSFLYRIQFLRLFSTEVLVESYASVQSCTNRYNKHKKKAENLEISLCFIFIKIHPGNHLMFFMKTTLTSPKDHEYKIEGTFFSIKVTLT